MKQTIRLDLIFSLFLVRKYCWNHASERKQNKNYLKNKKSPILLSAVWWWFIVRANWESVSFREVCSKHLYQRHSRSFLTIQSNPAQLCLIAILLVFLLCPFANVWHRGRHPRTYLPQMTAWCSSLRSCFRVSYLHAQRKNRERSWVTECTLNALARSATRSFFVLFFIFSTKPCVRWTRNKEKNKVQPDVRPPWRMKNESQCIWRKWWHTHQPKAEHTKSCCVFANDKLDIDAPIVDRVCHLSI